MRRPRKLVLTLGTKKASFAALLALIAVAGLPPAGATAAIGAVPRARHHKPTRARHTARRRHRRKSVTKTNDSSTNSLYRGLAPRPGPDILYAPVAAPPELSNAGVWRASPILVSGASAYRDGEFLYQDWLFDDHGAHEVSDPNYPGSMGDLFSKPDGTYDYPSGPGYENNAADLVEFRVKPTTNATVLRVTLNTLENPALVAFSLALGGTPGQVHPFPDGANVSAPADLFLTVHPSGSKLVADLVHAGNGVRAGSSVPSVLTDLYRHQITVSIPHSDWNPGTRTVRMAMGVGLWDAAKHRYLLPQQAADATHPGGAGTAENPAAFFNVGFRSDRQEPLSAVTQNAGVVTDPRWWRDEAQGAALAGADISAFHADVNFATLWRKVTDNSQVPRTGPFDMVLPSHFTTGQGADFSSECGLNGASKPSSCVPEYRSRLQPFAIYVPSASPPRAGFGLTLLLHSLSSNYNQYIGTRNQSQFANRSTPSIVITPEARGPDQFYEGLGEADVFEVWAFVAHRYPLNPVYTDITGYSMGGFGTFDVGAQFPDLFARAQPTVGEETDNNVLASLRNLPVEMWNTTGDELVGPTSYGPTEMKLANLGYRIDFHLHQPCASTNPSVACSALFPDHLELAVNDQYQPAADFLDAATVDRNPFHVTYVADPARDTSKYGVVGNHAYWISNLTVRQAGSEGQIDAVSRGFGLADPTPSGLQNGTGTLTGGNLGPLAYLRQTQTWGPTPSAPKSDTLLITATNIATATVNVARSHLDCDAKVQITTDGPVAVTLAGCGRVVRAG